jgi:hypothetical protein
MADVQWPQTLDGNPYPSAPLYGWTETPGTSLARTQTDAGPAKLRRRFTSTPSQFSMQFAMTEAQATRLMEFYSNSTSDTPAGTSGGSMTFGTFDHPRTNTDGTWRFLAPPVITQDAFEHFRVSIQLELLP